jgi:guanylate kinase
MSSKPGPLIIVSGPSGAGKSTLIHRVLEAGKLPLRLSVSATTRPRRPGERDGVDYHFWTEEQYRRALDAGEFLEHAEVHGKRYGTLKSEVDDYLPQGIGVILDIDVQGAEQVRPLYPEHVSVFVKTPDGQFEKRLRERKTEDEASIARRLANARRELEHEGEYQYVVVNDDREAAAGRLLEVIRRHF